MNNFKELNLWQKSMDLVVEVYKKTKYFPSEEKYGLISQINRCSVSIPSNIAEGAGRNSKKEFMHFLAISAGSSFELETQLLLAHRLGYLDIESLNLLVNEITSIQKMNYKLQSSLEKT